MRTLLTAVMNQAQAMGLEVKDGVNHDLFWIVFEEGHKVLVRPSYASEKMGIARSALRHLKQKDVAKAITFVNGCDYVVFLNKYDKEVDIR